jgi:hypothetical protein
MIIIMSTRSIYLYLCLSRSLSVAVSLLLCLPPNCPLLTVNNTNTTPSHQPSAKSPRLLYTSVRNAPDDRSFPMRMAGGKRGHKTYVIWPVTALHCRGSFELAVLIRPVGF